MFRTAVRNVFAHKARLLMTLLAVLLGVAFVSGTLVFTDTIGTAYKNQATTSYAGTAVGITSYPDPDGSGGDGHQRDLGVSAATVQHIAALPGVATATGRVDGFAGVADAKGKLIGNGWSNEGANFAPGKDGKDPRYAFVSGTGPTRAGQIAVDQDTARKGGFHVGSTARVATNGPVRTYTVTGVFTTDDGSVSAGGSLVLFDTASAQSLYLAPGHFKDVTVTAKPGASQTTLLNEIAPLLPKNSSAVAQTGQQLADQQSRDIEEQFSSLSTMLLAFAGIALFVGVFLIANTFTMLVAQRSRELALMRALGASRRQITRSVLTEALVVGVAASAGGFVAGVGIAVALRSAMTSFGAKVPGGPLVVAPSTVVVAFAVGVLITVLAAWLPARRAAKIPPVAAMSSADLPAPTKSLVLRNSFGGLLTAVGVALVLIGGAKGGTNGRWTVGGGAAVLLTGVIVLTPLLSQPVIAGVRPLLARVFGVSGNLAARNARRNPRRTAATASALAIGLSLVTGMTVLGLSLGRTIDKTTVDNVSADYMVQMANGMPLDGSVAKEIAKVPGVTDATAMQHADFTLDGHFTAVTAADPGGLTRTVRIDTVTGSRSALSQGKVLVADKVAKDHGWKVGDTVQADYPDGTHAEVTVGGTYGDNLALSDVVMPQSMLAPHVTKPEIQVVLVKTANGASAATSQAITDALGDNPAISVMDQQGIRDKFGGMINDMLSILYGLLGMSLVIAVLGVVNTLAMSVFERRREIGMLRAVGLDRRKVKGMIRLEAVVISLFGAATGIVLGLFVAWATGESISGSLPGYAMVLPWTRIAVFLALAALVGLLAAAWPARRAGRMDILESIKTE
ncbi:ABC transporter permease [Streptantibioticus parmotrematis]|uniref:ABC transporter permease n=1 Tax=Streptantibioticus parmotrematis TaxID=2873249 RepID=UPI00340A95CA